MSFQVMTVRVLGVGIGLFTIIAIWAFAVLFCIISHRTHKNVGTVVVVVATVVTLILILIPRDSEVPRKAVFKASTLNLYVWAPTFSYRKCGTTARNPDILCLDVKNINVVFKNDRLRA
jgi:hypothetical protein